MSSRAEKVETTRLEAFSDGVFAIAITLLGLELKVPVLAADASLAASLAAGWPSYVAFFTSFVTITVIWINHHRLFTHIFRVDHSLLLLNSLLLMAVTLVPFGTAVLADHFARTDQQQTAVMLYNGVFMALTGAFNLLWRHSARHHRLLDQTVDRRTIRQINFQYGFGPVLYGGAFCLSMLAPWTSLVADLMLVGFFALPVLKWSQIRRAGMAPDPDAQRPDPTAVDWGATRGRAPRRDRATGQ